MLLVHREHGHHEYQYAHAAHKMGKAPPEEDAPGQTLHRRKDGGAGGGEAGDGLEQSVHVAWNGTAEHEGERACEGENDPAQRHGYKTFPGTDIVPVPAQEYQKPSQEQGQDHGPQPGHDALAEDRCHRHGSYQQSSLNEQNAAQNV